jgi:broad specificity phosphatase PhoE
MEIIIVRHGLSEANKAGIVSGHLDTPLTKEGHMQAKKLAERLTGKKIEAIYSSPLKRAMETALPLAEKLGIEINVDRRIMEVSFGDFESKSNEKLRQKLGMAPRDLLDTYEYDFSSFNGESSDEVRSRVDSFLKDLKEQPHKTVLVVAHGGIVRWLHYLITGEKITWMPNAEELHLKS